MDLAHGDEIRVLGPLELVAAHTPVALPARKERQLLVALLVGAGEIRPSEVLVDAVWGSEPPASAGKLLQVYVSKLRRVLPGSARIRTHQTGYALELDGQVLDSARFEGLLSEGREARRAGNPALAASTLRRGLALWRGRAYAEFSTNDFGRTEADRLDELRLVAEEELIEAELELGRHRELLPELHALADAHPLRERLQALAMIALYRSGRQSEALDLYAATHRRLGAELGLEPAAELRDLQVRILRHDATLAAVVTETEAAPPAVLPTPPTQLLGRERELREIGELLSRRTVRLLTLTGAGGSGKTRLAIEVALRNGPLFANGVAFVSLAPVRDAELVLPAIAAGLRIDQLGTDPLETVSAALRSREVLVVLDNFEHLRDAATFLVELSSRAPRLTLLVTSRVVLHLSGEHVYPVEPLAADAAVALFRERALEADVHFELDRQAPEVARICERLDGLPLAIELAARRIRALTPQELLVALERRLPLLTGGPRDLPARQQTLRSTLEWSVGLLDEDERRDVARLSVFPAGCGLEAAEAVCETTIERLSALVDHSLVLRTVVAEGSRYSMLETIRELAVERLEASGEAEAMRRRHAEHALRIAEALALSVDSLGSGERQRHDIAITEQDGMRAALDWAQEEDPELGLRLAIALEQFIVSTNPREGMRRFDALLERANDLPLELQARAVRDLGGATDIAGDLDGAFEHYERSLELFEELGEEAGILHLRFRIAQIFARRGEFAEARKRAEETLPRARDAGLQSQESDLLHVLSLVAAAEGRLEDAYELQRRSLEIYRELGGWPWGESMKLGRLSTYASHLGQTDEAEALGREALALSLEIESRARTIVSLAALALAARKRNDLERAGRLWAAIEAEHERAFDGGWATRRDEYAPHVLDPRCAELDRGLHAGARMSLEEAAAYALADSSAAR